MHIRVNNLVKEFPLAAGSNAKTFKALDGVNFEAQKGERIGIVGRNGAGKTTLLQILTGISPATSGEVSVEGDLRAILTLGMALRDDMTGRECVVAEAGLTGLDPDRLKEIEDEVEKFAEIGEFFDLPTRTYSTGMKSRLAFGIATSIEPEILIVDEALSVGDRQFGLKADAKMQSLCDKGGIVLLVSHSLAVLERLSNRCIWLEGGKIKKDGAPTEVLGAYKEAMKAEVEAKLLAHFQKRHGGSSRRAGASLKVSLLDAEKRESFLFSTGDPATLRIEAPGFAAPEPLHLRVERTDGIVLFQTTMPAPRKGQCLEASLTPLRFGHGTYEVILEAHEESPPQAIADYRFPLRVEDPAVHLGATGFSLDCNWSFEDKNPKGSPA